MDNKILNSANEYYKKNNIPTTTIDKNIYLELDNDQFQLSENDDFAVNDDATKAQIKRAFVKSLKTKKMNKKILGAFVELVA